MANLQDYYNGADLFQGKSIGHSSKSAKSTWSLATTVAEA